MSRTRDTRQVSSGLRPQASGLRPQVWVYIVIAATTLQQVKKKKLLWHRFCTIILEYQQSTKYMRSRVQHGSKLVARAVLCIQGNDTVREKDQISKVSFVSASCKRSIHGSFFTLPSSIRIVVIVNLMSA
jgi:hypothetical protein